MSADPSRRNRVRRLALIAACLAVAPAFAQRGALTVPAGLNELTDRASDIVRGRVVSARVEKHPELQNLDTVVVTLRLSETLKGSARGTFTFRQYLWDIRDKQDAAGYLKGREYLLLMIAPSAYGLSSPAGMGQGRFRIVRDRAGRELALNGAGNVRLFDGLAAAADKEGVALSAAQSSLAVKHRRGAVDARELSALIRALARSGS